MVFAIYTIQTVHLPHGNFYKTISLLQNMKRKIHFSKFYMSYLLIYSTKNVFFYLYCLNCQNVQFIFSQRGKKSRKEKLSRGCRHEAEYLSHSDNLNETVFKIIEFLINKQNASTRFPILFPTTVFKLKYILNILHYFK